MYLSSHGLHHASPELCVPFERCAPPVGFVNMLTVCATMNEFVTVITTDVSAFRLVLLY